MPSPDPQQLVSSPQIGVMGGHRQMLGHRQWLERGQACTHSWRLTVWTTFADPASFPGLSPQFRKPSFSLPPLHLATLSPRCSLSRQRSRWREGCRQQRGGICLQQSGGAGSPYKEWVGELLTGWRRKEGGGRSLVQVSKRPSTPKASPLTHAFSVLLQGPHYRSRSAAGSGG